MGMGAQRELHFSLLNPQDVDQGKQITSNTITKLPNYTGKAYVPEKHVHIAMCTQCIHCVHR